MRKSEPVAVTALVAPEAMGQVAKSLFAACKEQRGQAEGDEQEMRRSHRGGRVRLTMIFPGAGGA